MHSDRAGHPPNLPDWPAIEADYRAGILTLRAISEAHPGVTHQAIAKRAKRDDWTSGGFLERQHVRAGLQLVEIVGPALHPLHELRQVLRPVLALKGRKTNKKPARVAKFNCAQTINNWKSHKGKITGLKRTNE